MDVLGEDRFRWLSGMVTNTVNELAANAGAWNLVLNAQGRILGELHVWREGDGLNLVIAADQVERLLAHLERFIIMDDVELAPRSETALGLAGPLAGEVLARLGDVYKRQIVTINIDCGCFLFIRVNFHQGCFRTIGSV